MKKLIIYLLILLSGCVPACKKEKVTPVTPPPTTHGMTATETSLLGKWYNQKIEYRDANNIITNTDTMEYHYGDYHDFQSSNCTTTNYQNDYYNCSSTCYNGSPMLTPWKATSDSIYVVACINGSSVFFKIITLTSTDLVYCLGDPDHGGTRYYYHK